MRKRTEKNTQEQRQFEDSQSTKQIEANVQAQDALKLHEVNLVNIKGEWQYKEAYLTALGRDSASTTTDDFDQLTKAFQNNLKAKAIDADIDYKNRDLNRKMDMDEDTRKIEAEKIKLKAEEMRLRKEQLDNQKFISIINKN